MLLGLGGFATSGKDAVADFLVENHGFYKTYMSKPLEKALLKLNPYINGFYPKGELVIHDTIRYSEIHEEFGYEKSKEDEEVRRLLQVFGTEIGRNMFGEDTWINLMVQEVEYFLENEYNVVVTGIRFQNEKAAIKKLGGRLGWVHRPGVVPVNAHVSDNTLTEKDFHLTFWNDGTLEDLASSVGHFATNYQIGTVVTEKNASNQSGGSFDEAAEKNASGGSIDDQREPAVVGQSEPGPTYLNPNEDEHITASPEESTEDGTQEE